MNTHKKPFLAGLRITEYQKPIKHHKVSHRRNLAPCQRQRAIQASHNSNPQVYFGLFQQIFFTYRVIPRHRRHPHQDIANTHNSDAPPKMAAKSRRHCFVTTQDNEKTYIPP